MSKLLQSISSSSLRYSRSMDVRSFGRPEGTHEPAAPPFAFRVARKLRILRIGSRRTAGNSNVLQTGPSAKPVEEPSKTFLGRLRLAFERVMIKAASKSGPTCAVPVAKASRAPPALSSVVSTHPIWLNYGSGAGTKISELDPGFKLTAAEKKYLEHLKRTASS